jgi:aminoglycoside 2'-N-acetyltransferase I
VSATEGHDGGWTELRAAHTADLTPEDLLAVRVLLDGAFPADEAYTEEDHEHALGGVHALLWEGQELIGHGSVVMRRLLHDGRALRTGYVEAVAVRADRRRRGHGDLLMGTLERVIRQGYVLGALSTSGMAGAFYAARGWQVWTGTVSVVTPHGVERAEDEEGGIYVLPGSASLTAGGDLACDWRDGEPW